MGPGVAAGGDRIGHGLFAGPHAAALLARTPPELMGTAGGMTTLVRTVGFSTGPAVGARWEGSTRPSWCWWRSPRWGCRRRPRSSGPTEVAVLLSGV
ncbi:hypothetical protein ACRAKI_08125 [Saccharothrix isguenensis]